MENDISLEIVGAETGSDASVVSSKCSFESCGTSKCQGEPADEQEESCCVTFRDLLDEKTPEHTSSNCKTPPTPKPSLIYRAQNYEDSKTPPPPRASFVSGVDTPHSPREGTVGSNSSLDEFLSWVKVEHRTPERTPPQPRVPFRRFDHAPKQATQDGGDWEGPFEYEQPANPTVHEKSLAGSENLLSIQNHEDCKTPPTPRASLVNGVDTPYSPSENAVGSNDSLDQYLSWVKAVQRTPERRPFQLPVPFYGCERTAKQATQDGGGCEGSSESEQPASPIFHGKSLADSELLSSTWETPELKTTADLDDSLDVMPLIKVLDLPTRETGSSVTGLEGTPEGKKATNVFNPRAGPSGYHQPQFRRESPKHCFSSAFKRPKHMIVEESVSSCLASKHDDSPDSESKLLQVSTRKILHNSVPGKPSESQKPPLKIAGKTGPSPSKSRPKYVPKNVKTPKASVRKISSSSDDDSPTSKSLEVASSNDSLIAPAFIRNTVRVSKKGEARKKDSGNVGLKRKRNAQASRGSLDKFLKKSPAKSPPKDGCPSPYKTLRPAYLPKNIKLAKKKRKQREDFIKVIEGFDEKLMQLPDLTSNPEAPKPDLTDDFDIMGTRTPVIVFLHPDKFFKLFDELTCETYLDVDISHTARTVRFRPDQAAVKDFRDLTIYLSVTTDHGFLNNMRCCVEEALKRNHFVLDWNDLKTIFLNFGLAKTHSQYDSKTYNHASKSPKVWNFRFLFMVLEFSIPSYETNRLMRLLGTLSGVLFDPLLVECQVGLSKLIRLISEQLLMRGAAPEELVSYLDRRADSWICNRFIIPILTSYPRLRPLARILAYNSIRGILQVEPDPDRNTLSGIADLLGDVVAIKNVTTVKDIYQLISICESLVAMTPSPFDDETKRFLERLADFTEEISMGYSYFENLLFTDSISRIKCLSNIDRI